MVSSNTDYSLNLIFQGIWRNQRVIILFLLCHKLLYISYTSQYRDDWINSRWVICNKIPQCSLNSGQPVTSNILKSHLGLLMLHTRLYSCHVSLFDRERRWGRKGGRMPREFLCPVKTFQKIDGSGGTQQNGMTHGWIKATICVDKMTLSR